MCRPASSVINFRHKLGLIRLWTVFREFYDVVNFTVYRIVDFFNFILSGDFIAQDVGAQ